MVTETRIQFAVFAPPYAPKETPYVVAIEKPERTDHGEIVEHLVRIDLGVFERQVDAVCFAREMADLFEKYGGVCPGLRGARVTAR